MRTISRSVKYITRSITGVMNYRRIPMLQMKSFLKINMQRIRTIALLENFRGIFGGLGYEIWKFR